MLEAKINEYGKDKLKNLAKYEKNEFYPIIHQWSDLHSTEPKKFILYFAMPDDKGSTFVIPAKWCEDIRHTKDADDMAFELNDSAWEQLKKVGKFSNDYLYPIISVWQDNSSGEDNKKKFDVYFAILNDERKVFIVQSTWGKLILLDETGAPLYL